VAGLKYISGIIVAGTYFAKTMRSLPTPVTVDPSDPTSVQNAVNSLISQCNANLAACESTDTATMGAVVVNLAGTYCQSSSADQTVCDQVNTTVNQVGGDPAAVGQAILCVMNHKTYNAGTGLCQ